MRVVAPEGSWDVVDPCLTTWEGQHLVSWLLLVAARDPSAPPLSLTEPNVTMTARTSPDDPLRVLVRACFALELRPPWARTVSGGHELCIDLDLDREDVARAAASLLADLVRYPQRGDDPTL